MKSSLKTIRIALSVIVVLGGLLWIARPGKALFQPPIPHPVEGRDNCLGCHQEGLSGAPKIPDSHAGRTNEMCRLCHQSAATAATATPETSATEPPSSSSDSVPSRISHPAAKEDANSCADCHKKNDKTKQIVADWEAGIHAERNVGCADCHGGDPNATDMGQAMSSSAGFIGKIDRSKIPEVCGSCHADVNLMRQYNLPTDQYAKYQESLHGQKLKDGDPKVATCFDCHDGHATREPNDPRASVYRLNVPNLCGKCHADKEYMAGYDIPTDQFDLYKESVHGIALLKNQDTRAPNCATCHGTHGAAPPGFSEVANVCGSCHTATQDYYLKGKHNSVSGDTPKCVTCHGRYDVQMPSESMFVGTEPRHCGSCHAPDSQVGKTVTEIYQKLSDADRSLKDAESTVNQARSLGMIVAEEDSMLANARTKLITARAAQHNIDPDTAGQISQESIELSKQANDEAGVAISQGNFRRQAMVIAVAAIVVVIGSLVAVRRQLISGR